MESLDYKFKHRNKSSGGYLVDSCRFFIYRGYRTLYIPRYEESNFVC